MTTTKRGTTIITSIQKNGKTLNSSSNLFEIQSLSDISEMTITECGGENVYFTFTDDEGIQRNGFCKCL
jgi:hypothetical protein